MNIEKVETTYQLPTYEKLPLTIVKGKGSYVWDEKGRKYLDFYGGHAVALLGHCHPEVVRAVASQMKKLIFYSNVVYNKERAIAAREIVSLAGESFSSVFFCNSGTEANETALKLAKKFSGKDEIISFKGSFHGRTLGSLSVTGFDSYKKQVGALAEKVKFAVFGDIESVKRLITPNMAAVILETIQSIAGVNEATPEFYRELRKICTEKNIVLIFDEVQTGFGRTGKMFYGEHVGVDPDVICLAKGIAGGLPAGAVIVNRKIAESVAIGDQGSTFGGGPVVCAAITACIEVIKKEDLVNNAERMDMLLKDKLSKKRHVIEVRGKGLLLGIMFDIPAKQIQAKLLKRGIITGTSADKFVLRIMPPLTVTEKEIEFFVGVLDFIL